MLPIQRRRSVTYTGERGTVIYTGEDITVIYTEEGGTVMYTGETEVLSKQENTKNKS